MFEHSTALWFNVYRFYCLYFKCTRIPIVKNQRRVSLNLATWFGLVLPSPKSMQLSTSFGACQSILTSPIFESQQWCTYAGNNGTNMLWWLHAHISARYVHINTRARAHNAILPNWPPPTTARTCSHRGRREKQFPQANFVFLFFGSVRSSLMGMNIRIHKSLLYGTDLTVFTVNPVLIIEYFYLLIYGWLFTVYLADVLLSRSHFWKP